jgi:cysteinyl-tRNA synthetase
MLCLQAHYRSELEFSWDNLAAALTRLKKMLLGISRNSGNRAVLKDLMDRFDNAISNDLGTPAALPIFEEAIWSDSLSTVKYMDQVMGLDLANLNRADLRIRPKSATLTEAEIEAALDKRAEARAAKDFATSDAIRDDLIAKGVEVMDGDPLRWEWKLDLA